MTSTEFLDKCNTLAIENGFTFISALSHSTSVGKVNSYRIEFENKSPSVFEVILNTSDNDITIYYDSVLYNYAPTGNISITTKHYSNIIKTNKLDKFKWDVLEKWLKNQNGVKLLFIEDMKKKVIEERMKKMEKDF